MVSRGRTGPVVSRAVVSEELVGASVEGESSDELFVVDASMVRLVEAARRVARAPVNVLVLGETGVGKEVIATALHRWSGRTGPLVFVNCASLPAPLVESELFGYERGAFTGAIQMKRGLFEVASEGTLVLDEVGELPRPLQAVLLRAIETREIQRIGGVRTLPCNTRIVAATHRDLEAEVAEDVFRQDLYFRLSGVTLSVPPLRARPADIVALAQRFLFESCQRCGLGQKRFSDAALARLSDHAWPGNVRELKNVVERTALFVDDATIDAESVLLPVPRSPDSTFRDRAACAWSRKEGDTSAVDEAQSIAATLLACGGNQRRAAEQLGLSRRTLVRKIARLGLPRPRSEH
jgi:two-component system, NtrC family, response regulator AtoC